MLIILFVASNLFGINMPIINYIINTMLYYITPISVISLVIYLILSFKLIEILISIALALGVTLDYLTGFADNEHFSSKELSP